MKFWNGDPLDEILERHLYRGCSEGEEEAQTIEAIVEDYLRFLRSQGLHVSNVTKLATVADLREEIKELIVKKTRGSVNIMLNPGSGHGTSPRGRRTV